MTRKTELIDEIENDKKIILELTEKLQERYRILGGRFVSAKMLVPPDQWQDWLSANCDINHESAEFIMAGEAKPPDINRIFLSNASPQLLGFTAKSEGSVSNGRGRGRPKKQRISME